MLKSPTQSEVEWFDFQTEMSGTFLLPNFTLSDESNIFYFRLFVFPYVCFSALRISPSLLIHEIFLWSKSAMASHTDVLRAGHALVPPPQVTSPKSVCVED